MLREGLTNRQIARQLGISHRTARYHVSEILSKLSAGDRHEAAMWSPEDYEAPPPKRGVLLLPTTLRLGLEYLVRGLSVAIVVAAVAGMGLLAVGVLRTSEERNSAEARKPLETRPPTPMPTPIPGLTYDIVYRVSDGTLMAHGSHLEGEPVAAVVEDGQALLQLPSSYPNLQQILADVNSFYVSPATMEIEWRPGRPCEGDPYQGDPPCEGFAYELVYWEADGKINSFGVYDACGGPYTDCAAAKPSAILEPGQAWMSLFGDPRVKDLMQHMDAYYVDVETKQLRKK